VSEEGRVVAGILLPLLPISSIPWPRFDATIEIPTLHFRFP
jgi:hypothetical protein